MTDPKEAPREFLNEALSALERLDSDRTELGQLRQQTMSDERALKELGSSCEKEKQQLINERRSSLKADFDKQLRSLDKELKTVSDKRKKARQKGVKSRIKDETAELRSQNVQKQKSIRELHTKSGLSRLSAGRLYYALFMPKGIGEWLIAALCFILLFIGLPALLYALLPGSGMLKHILIYAVIIVGIGGAYIHITNITKLKAPEAIREGRRLLDEIKRNERDIRKISRGIKRDNNDGVYDLGSFDDRLTELNGKHKELEAAMEQALLNFDKVTKCVLSDEVDAKYKTKLDELSEALKERKLSEDRKQAEISKEEQELLDYAKILGRDELNKKRLTELIGAFDKNEASTLSEAIDKIDKK